MANTESRVTIHMAASLDGFIARKDGSVDWLETSDQFEGGEVMAPDSATEFLRTIDCYVMGSGLGLRRQADLRADPSRATQEEEHSRFLRGRS